MCWVYFIIRLSFIHPMVFYLREYFSYFYLIFSLILCTAGRFYLILPYIPLWSPFLSLFCHSQRVSIFNFKKKIDLICSNGDSWPIFLFAFWKWPVFSPICFAIALGEAQELSEGEPCSRPSNYAAKMEHFCPIINIFFENERPVGRHN